MEPRPKFTRPKIAHNSRQQFFTFIQSFQIKINPNIPSTNFPHSISFAPSNLMKLFPLIFAKAFEQQSSIGARRCCHHTHLDDGLCGRFMRRQFLGHHYQNSCHHHPTVGIIPGGNGPSRGRLLNGTCGGAISGWDLAEEGDEAELYSLQMDMPIKGEEKGKG